MLVRWCNGSTELFGGFSHGSNPCRTTKKTKELGHLPVFCTDFAQHRPSSPPGAKFPLLVEFKGQRAAIYQPAKGYDFYRVCFRVTGKRRMLTYTNFASAKKAAEEKVRELYKGNHSVGLTAKQSQDVVFALERLREFNLTTSRKVSLYEAVGDYIGAATLIGNGRSLVETSKTFIQLTGSVKPCSVYLAVEEFVTGLQVKAHAPIGQRAQLSETYVYNSGLWLRRFAKPHQSTAISDLQKSDLDSFMATLKALSPKSRNHYRAIIKTFLVWCVRKDYLAASHRLSQADSMIREGVEGGVIDFYRPDELRQLLQHADAVMRPIIALQALAGVRGMEALRLTWQDVFATAGHVTISAAKSKTRSRRLVEICPSLHAWLEPYRNSQGKLWSQCRDTFYANFVNLRDASKIPARKNGLRRGFGTFHFALYSNENLTAAQMGNTPQMVHAHYRGMATKLEAENWFSIKPTAVPTT